MATPSTPTYDGRGPYQGLNFQPQAKWYDGTFDPARLRALLVALPGLGPFQDALGNEHCSVRLDLDPEGAVGIWVTVPQGTSSSVVDTLMAAAPTTIANEIAAEQAQATATAWVELRMKRDRWLAQTDYIEAFINSPTVFQHLPAAIQSDITGNSTAWATWRQALRDLPANTADPSSATWPTPPAAPVIHLT